MLEEIPDGATDGRLLLGIADGRGDGREVGFDDGDEEEIVDGRVVGFAVMIDDGRSLDEGVALGLEDVAKLGFTDGNDVGSYVGSTDSRVLGVAENVDDGDVVDMVVGQDVAP